MTHDLEEALRGTLNAAAHQAPLPEPDLLDVVVHRHRIRRRNRAGLACAAVLVVLGASGAVAADLGAGDHPARPTMTSSAAPGPLPTVTPIKAVPVQTLWPQAVRSVPAKLPNGRKFRPITLLDENSLLVATQSSFEVTDELSTYDIPARRVTSVTKVVVPAGSSTYASDFTVGDGQVAWWLTHKSGDRTHVDIWAAPLSGGPARKVTFVDGGETEDVGLSRLAIGGGKVTWSMDAEAPGAPAGLFEAPLSGGPSRKIPDTDGYEIVSWPWIGSPRAGENSDRSRQVTFRKVRNMQTGEERDAGLSNPTGTWVCGVTWCIGGVGSDVTFDWPGGVFVQRRDGRGGRELPSGRPPMGSELPIYDRFMIYEPPGKEPEGPPNSPVLYDLSTGNVADLGIPRDLDGNYALIDAEDPASRLYTVALKSSYLLIDLATIG